MAFKMKGFQAHDSSPLKVDGKWSTWTGDRQKFIGDEIEARRKKFAEMDAAAAKAKSGEKDKDKDKNTTTTTTDTSKDTKTGRVEHALDNPNLEKYVKQEKGSTEGGVYTPGEKSLSSYSEAWDLSLIHI